MNGMGRDTDGLTDKQRRFVAEYLIDSNGAQAAIRAGYSRKSAREIAHQLLDKTSHPAVAAAVAQGQAQMVRRAEITKDEAIRIMAGLLRKKGRGVSPRDKVAVAARLAAMLDWDAPKKIDLNPNEARAELARQLGMNPEELDRAAGTVH